MDDLHLLRPLWLWGLAPAVLVWFGLWRIGNPVDTWKRVIDSHLLEHLLVGETRRRWWRPVHLALVLWVLCVLALAGPSWQREPSPFADDTAGLVVLLKASSTMDASDVQPSRFERCTHKLSDLLELRRGAATGLVVYSGSAHLVMPLTRDGRIITDMAAEISPDLMPVDGDALGEAIELATTVLDRAGVSGSVLVMADAVAPTEVEAVASVAPGMPVQFLAVGGPGAPVDDGLIGAARARGASVTKLTVDSADVERIARRAETDVRSAAATDGGERWRDEGYLVLPLIALVALAWSRKGWVVS